MKYFSIEYFEELKKIASAYLTNNYDYCYLDAMHEKNRKIGAKTIITGSSYTVHGITEKDLKGDVINFSLASQDIYYDFLNIKKACEEGKQTIENCIINIGYYALFQDLSLSKKKKDLIREIYEPLFHDPHHTQIESPYDPLEEAVESGKEFFSKELITFLCREWSRNCFWEQSSFYGIMCAKRSSYIPKGIEWGALPESLKEVYTLLRTFDHNRLYAYKESRTENARLIEEMVEYLSSQNIRTIFVVFPFTKWYNQNINPQYKEDIYQLLDNLELPVEFFDMNELDCFSDSDFLDMDHLNDRGAEKASLLLNDFLNC